MPYGFKLKECTASLLANEPYKCPRCNCNVQTAGFVFLISGTITFLFFAMLLFHGAEKIGFILAVPQWGIGVMRIIKQYRLFR